MPAPTRPSPTSSTPPPVGSTGTTTADCTGPSAWFHPPSSSKSTTLPSSPRNSPHENGTKPGTLHPPAPPTPPDTAARQPAAPEASPAPFRVDDDHERSTPDDTATAQTTRSVKHLPERLSRRNRNRVPKLESTYRNPMVKHEPELHMPGRWSNG